MSLSYILLCTDYDGTESAYGPFSWAAIDKQVESTQLAFPDAHVRSVAILNVRTLQDDKAATK